MSHDGSSNDDDYGTPFGDFIEGKSPLGKYLLIEVPNFNSYDGGEPMSSYLRLGAVKDPTLVAKADAPRDTGEDLASHVVDFIDDTRKRKDGGSECPGYVSQEDRQKETSRLHTKGGWRDHSDGNRISTTRGDKVEVIRGNYRRLVLGRRDDEEDASSLDISGGHVSEGGITFEGESHIEWVQNYDGTWRSVEKTIKGDVFSTYQGDTHDWYYGNIKHSTTGSESPGEQQENPEVVDHTWAERIESYTGSSALPVPSISDETWAEEISSVTNADSITDETNATTIDSTTTAATTTSTTTANVFDTTVGTTTNVFVGMETEIVTGMMNEITLGMQNSLTVGLLIDITVALMMDLCLSGKLEVSLGATWEFDATAKYQLAPTKAETVMNKTDTAMKAMRLAVRHDIT